MIKFDFDGITSYVYNEYIGGYMIVKDVDCFYVMVMNKDLELCYDVAEFSTYEQACKFVETLKAKTDMFAIIEADKIARNVVNVAI